MPACGPMEVVRMVLTIIGTLIKNDPQVDILNADPRGRFCQSLLRLIHIELRCIVQGLKGNAASIFFRHPK